METQTHLFSHLPLHSQQPFRSPYSMVPVGGIQLVPAGLAAYSTFVPIQAGPVQLTIPAVSVIHRNTSPSTAPNSSPRPDGVQTQPLVIQEPISNVVPCFPIRQVTDLQGQTLQPTLSLMGLTNTGLAAGQMLPQQGVALQVLAASPTSQTSTTTQTHMPGLQIVNIALPAIIPSLSPLPCRSPLPWSSDALGAQSSQTESPSACAATPRPVSTSPELNSGNGPGPVAELTRTLEKPQREKSSQQHAAPQSPAHSVASPKQGGDDAPKRAAPVANWKKVIDDFNEVSSDDEDRLVIAT